MKKRRVFFDVMTIEKLNKKIAKGKIKKGVYIQNGKKLIFK